MSDLVTVAGGFGFLAFWWIFKVRTIEKAPSTLQISVLCGYYIFFSLFTLCSALRIEFIRKYCGFLVHPTYKSIWYLM